jgi:hypothetical protein
MHDDLNKDTSNFHPSRDGTLPQGLEVLLCHQTSITASCMLSAKSQYRLRVSDLHVLPDNTLSTS